MLPRQNRITLRRDALNSMSTAMGAKAFTATIDMSNAVDQQQCLLYSEIPSEIRTRIFELACTASDDLEKLYGTDRVYYRPDYKCRQNANIALLQTCKQIFEETRLMPVKEAEHTFWMFGGPLRLLRTRKHAVGNFSEWQNSLTKAQQCAVKHVHLFVQQFYFEQMGTRHMISELKFKTKSFKITFRHSDWWSWGSPPESSDRLGICPWLPDRVSHQAMLSQQLEPTIQQLKATMIKGTWGWQIGQIVGLEVLEIEFETDIVKKDQMKCVLERAKHWKFLLHDSDAVLESNGEIRESEWVGQAHLKQDNTPALRQVIPEAEAAVPMRTFHVAQMKWKRRTLNLEEMALFLQK